MPPVLHPHGRPMHWQICQCSNPACAFRFPVEAADRRRLHCPLCNTPTHCSDLHTSSEVEGAAPATAPRPRIELHLLLDNLRSTYNVGSILRTADGAGVCSLHLCGITPTPEHPRVAKTALGAERSASWRYHRNALYAADALVAAGVHLWALELDANASSLFDLAPPQDQALVLVIGNEITGVDPALRARCERVVRLPMQGRKGSLNVASAAAVAVYWLCFGEN